MAADPTGRLAAAVAAEFALLTPAQKPALLTAAPDLYLATARLARTLETRAAR